MEKKRLSPAARREKRSQAMARYNKYRQRNVLAKPGCHDIILVLDNLKGGFNVPKIFRSAEAFGVHEVHLVNIPPFDPAPSKGAFRKVPARFHERFRDCHEDLVERGYRLFALEPGCACQLHATTFPAKSAFIMGHEEFGMSFDKDAYPDIECLSIRQFGITESLNVSVAASIVMYEYARQHGNED